MSDQPADLEGAKADFVSRCRQRGLSLSVWVGRSRALGGLAVCYCGPLRDCETAENWVIRAVQRARPGVPFCYVFPAPESAEVTT